MVSSRAASVAVYLDELPAERRVVVAAVRDLVLRNLQSGFVECMGFGMIGYVIPLARYPVTYNKQPLCYVALAAQKNSYSLYLMGAYADPHKYETLQAAYAKAGKKFDMGKSCLRFKKIDDLLVDAVAANIASLSVDDYIAHYEIGHGLR